MLFRTLSVMCFAEAVYWAMKDRWAWCAALAVVGVATMGAAIFEKKIF